MWPWQKFAEGPGPSCSQKLKIFKREKIASWFSHLFLWITFQDHLDRPAHLVFWWVLHTGAFL